MISYEQTGQIPLAELTPYPGNARRGDVDMIAESLAKNGQYRSLIVRRTDGGEHVVLAGNHTMAALAQLGSTSARCEIITCDDTTAARVNLADNRTADDATYDDRALLAILESLPDLEGTGYDADALDDLAALTGSVPETEPGPTGARYAEDPEAEAARRDRIESYEPRAGADGATTELILVMTVADRQEAAELVAAVRTRDGDDLTAGQVVLYALRSHAAGPEEESSDE